LNSSNHTDFQEKLTVACRAEAFAKAGVNGLQASLSAFARQLPGYGRDK